MEAAAYVSLFVSAFAAATILPLSSEAVLSALVAAEGFDIWFLIGIASIANTLGAAVNWVLGRYCLRWRDHRWFPVSASALDRASTWFARYGQVSLLFAWVPIVGDPLTFAAGILRVPFWRFLLLVAIGKTLRYVAVALLAERVLT
ncbi:MAG: DedA family protein [Alphaproteobacteria bacterium]|mgnify:FL=1|nr:DedA family protein [Alphaproteobacteria bacterium]